MTFVAFQGSKEQIGIDDRSVSGQLAACWSLIASEDAYDKSHKPPLVSLVVTAYNYEKYVGECLHSIHQQTYTNFECIVVDDGSADATRAVAQATVAPWKDDRFSVVAPPKNLGQLGAQSFGFARTQGQFVVFVDADDLLKPNFIERHLYAHLNMQMPVGFTSSDQWNIDADGTVLSFHHPDLNASIQSGGGSHITVRADEKDNRPINSVVLNTSSLGDGFAEWWWATQSTMMFRRGILDVVLPDPAEAGPYRTCADFFLVRFAHLLSASALLCETLGSYRRHDKNNFCSNMLLSADVPVGDMRKHPKLESFYSLALSIVGQRKEAFIGILGEERYYLFVANFRRNLERIQLQTARPADWKKEASLFGLRKTKKP
jgi:glycosyltransferase involved in cell wall biosynthesis